VLGKVVDDRYRVLRQIAQGGMADVYLAKDSARKCHVAVKILRSRSPESQRRFAVEAELLSNIKSAGIAQAIDFGKTDDNQSYMALEYLEGGSLSDRLAQGPLPWRDVAEYGAQIAGALHALHVAGIVHRDLKPGNIMMTRDGDRSVAKLIDLGLASVGKRFQDAQDEHFTPDLPARHPTQLGQPIGTPAYLPPEAGQCAAEPRLDVFALGVTIYQLCTGELPQSTDRRPVHVVCSASDAPEDLSRLLLAALEPDPLERLPSADHLRRGLVALLAAHPRMSSPRHLFAGSYDRLEVLGVGASTVVYRASDRALSRQVALKILKGGDQKHDDDAHEDDLIRFRRATRVLSAVRHSSVPQIHHTGIHDGQLFAVTELCSGAPATTVVRPDKHLRPDEVLAVGLQLAGALAAVHAAGVVYRDLHPGNVLIARGDSLRAWLFDFDQAQVSPEFYAALTGRWDTPPEARAEPKREKPLQTCDYASPEVRADAAFSTASDVYALGLLLYRLLTGKRPFPANSSTDPISPRKLCPRARAASIDCSSRC
jgi:serine/threonine protein kinase